MKKEFTTEEATSIGQELGVDFSVINITEFQMGLSVELEHGSQWGDETNVTKDDPLFTGRIAWAHLKEIPDYYTRLKKMEAEAEN